MTDYVKITHNIGANKVCGDRKYSFESRLCSSVVYISYKAPTTGSGYQGFRLYYESKGCFIVLFVIILISI